MKKQTFSLLAGAVLAVALLLVSCHSSYEVTKVEGGRIPMNSVWDAEPDAEAVALLAPYKARMDSVMYHVVGTAEMSMDRFRPESLLSNLIADVLREAGQTGRYGANQYRWNPELPDGRRHHYRKHL